MFEYHGRLHDGQYGGLHDGEYGGILDGSMADYMIKSIADYMMGSMAEYLMGGMMERTGASHRQSMQAHAVLSFHPDHELPHKHTAPQRADSSGQDVLYIYTKPSMFTNFSTEIMTKIENQNKTSIY